jgi:transcriptional regulator with XRE-family HTH domain
MGDTTKRSTELGKRARALREKAGLSFIDVEFELRQHRAELSPHTFSYGTVERIERGSKPEESVDTVFLALLAKIYGCSLEELSPAAAERATKIRQLLKQPRN